MGPPCQRSLRSKFPKLTVGLIGHHIEGTVRTLLDVANSLAAVDQQVFLSDDTAVAKHEAHQPRIPQATYEQAALPGGEGAAGVVLHAGGAMTGSQ